MASSRNQNRPPNFPLNKKDGGEEISLDKRRKVGGGGGGRLTGPTAASRARQVLSTVNSNNQDSASDAASIAETSESAEFTKEEVEALLNEKIKGKKFDLKGKLEQISESNKRLRLCIRWFQGVEQNLNQEQEKLRNSLDASQKKCSEIETEKKIKEDELNSLNGELRQNNVVLQEKLAKEESDKLKAIECHTREKEARAAAEALNTSLTQELEKLRQEKSDVDLKVKSVNDMYTRLQEYNTSLQQYNSKLQTDLATANATLQRVEKEKSTIVENLGALRGHYATLQDQLTSFRASQKEGTKEKETLSNEINRLQGELQQVRDERDRMHSQMLLLTSEIEKYKETTGKSVAELDNLMMKSNTLEETCASQREQLHRLQHQLASANEKLKMTDLSASEMKMEYEQQKQVIHQLRDRLVDAEHQINEKEMLRRKLHNTILELKGNIRVFCRVRPLLPEDGCASELPVISYPTSTEGHESGIDLLQSGQKYAFTFDKVFTHEATQNDVFVEISELVQSALDGYKVCIFAYGQTGSGKTYTMMGRPQSVDQKGLIPRSLEQIFETSQRLSAQGWKFKMQASVLEIYNESIRDLLVTNRTSWDAARTENGVSGKQYTIKHDANGDTYVSDLTIVDVCSSKEVASLLHQAGQCRSVGKTQMNEQSSRSHFVFTLRISAVNETTEKHGVLNLIDLAGSERLSKSGSTGDQLKETQAINKSLSCLADVIFALAKKENHVPFRNSKLTYLLQPCLSGDSKTLMFVNLSPEPSSVNESLCSLRFAARVNTCQIGVPRRQTAIRSSSDSRLSIG
ncbi:kinesin-like protein KIN-14C [Amaranthus tricolor]|uniref:kinesin-like protein KIN-14C n=1 Tax=Amaranthus tricolor TaxID=29722 RepID=UPI0025858FFA|nr:kinesin-like protein KIN-14C [Amaranthus tricolor]